MTVAALPLLRSQGYVDGRIGREGSSYGIDEWLELKYWAVGGIGASL